jgi:hypothetical protein
MKTIRSITTVISYPIILLTSAFLLSLAVLPQNTLSAAKQEKPLNNMIKTGINRAVIEYEPAVAVRGSGCLTCHAEINSNYITDFGYGSPYFFANLSEKNRVGFFNGHIYGDFIADPGKTGWLTAEFKKEIIVPVAPVDFNLEKVAGNTLADKKYYTEALKASSLAGYLRALENKKDKPAPIVEKTKIFIGAPDVETLESGFGIKHGDNSGIKYIKNDPVKSPEIKGIESGTDRKYYSNTGEITCDGDLFIDGMLFIDKPVIDTISGCRIYVTGPVFLQKEITYKKSGTKNDKSNLQIVSTEAIFLGVGREKCRDNSKTDPMALRLIKTPALPSLFTRSAFMKNISPQKQMQALYDKTALVPLEDSSCHDSAIGFSRLLLNAPVIHSRYSGRFKGLVIAEFALFWQGKTRFEFDPLFKEVPILPMLKESDYFMIEK